MPRTPIQFQQMKEERKLSILENALPLFATYGKNGVTIDMICQKSKCSHGIAYHYFKNVENIFEELLKTETYKDLFIKLNNFNFEIDAYYQIIETIKKLVNIAKEPRITIAFSILIISDDGKKSFHSNFVKLVGLGQKEGLITGGNPTDIVSTFIHFLKGLYLSILNEKHSNIRVPSIDNILKIFNR